MRASIRLHASIRFEPNLIGTRADHVAVAVRAIPKATVRVIRHTTVINTSRFTWQNNDSARTVGAVRIAFPGKHRPTTRAVRTAGTRSKRCDVAGGQRGENQGRGDDMTGFHGNEVGLKQWLSVGKKERKHPPPFSEYLERDGFSLSFIAPLSKVSALKPRPS